MTVATDKPEKPSMFPSDGIGAPLRYPVFRRIWLAGLLSNLGLMINGVGAVPGETGPSLVLAVLRRNGLLRDKGETQIVITLPE